MQKPLYIAEDTAIRELEDGVRARAVELPEGYTKVAFLTRADGVTFLVATGDDVPAMAWRGSSPANGVWFRAFPDGSPKQ